MENISKIKASLDKRNDSFDVDQMHNMVLERNKLQASFDDKTAEAKKCSAQIGQLFQNKADASEIEEAKTLANQLKSDCQNIEKQYNELDQNIHQTLLSMPNILHEDVPKGKDENDNVGILTWGDKPKFSFEPKTHDVLGEQNESIDFERASKLAGSRFSILKGQAATMERALVNFMLDQHKLKQYQELSVPFLVNSLSMTGTGQLPKFSDDAFKIDDTDYYLIPTAEVPVTNIFRDEILNDDMLPQKFCCYSPCFRKEAGSHGKDTKGLIRQHQFHKIELMCFVKPEDAVAAHEALTEQAERILQLLGLHYRKVLLCAGDTGFSAEKTYDLEVWLPGQNQYREISSCSNFADFQARRANIRYRKSDGKLDYVHTINGSGLAVGRTIIALFENYQKEDGSIEVPEILSPYMKGML